MRLAIISPAFPPQPTLLAQTASLLASGLVTRGHHIAAFIPNYYHSSSIDSRIQLYPLASLPDPLNRGQFILANFPTSLAFQISSFKPDIVLFINPQLHQFGLLKFFLSVKKIPLVSVYFPPISFISGFITTQLCRLSRLVISPTIPTTNYLMSAGITENLITIPTPNLQLPYKLSAPNIKRFISTYEESLTTLIHNSK